MLESGQILAARYGLLRKLAEGRDTQVWLARDRISGSDRVLKVLTSQSPADRERFLAALHLEQQVHHPNVRHCEAVHDGEPAFGEFANDVHGDLSQLRGRPWRELLPVLAGVADAVTALHARGWVHRDLKPANVLLGEGGVPLLADFGLAAPAGDATAPGGGSPFSMSPQQWHVEPPAVMDDVYGFGALAYELLGGYPPFYPEVNRDRVHAERPVPLPARAAVPDGLERLVQRCLAKDPRDRPAGLDVVAAELRALAADNAQASVVADRVSGPVPGSTVEPRRSRTTLEAPADAEAAEGSAGSNLEPPFAATTLNPPPVGSPIEPQWQRTGSTGPTAAELRWQGFRRGLVAGAFVFLLAAAGFVFVVLPQWVERKAAARPPAAAPASAPATAPAPAPDRNLQALADAKRAFEELRPKVAARLDALERRAAGVWGGDSFARGKRGLSDADAAFTRRDYVVALASLRTADASLAATEKLAADELKSALTAGKAALDAGDAAEARRRFERALQIEPANAVAKRGLERAGTLDEVRALLADAQAREARGDVAGAQAAYRKALALDRDTQAARDALARLQGQAAGAAFAGAMSRALELLARKDYAQARRAFEQAGRIRPGAPEVADGLAQIERALGDRTIAGHIAAAQQAEAAERWSEAVAGYRKALELDRNLLAAQQGLERAEPRAMIDAELNAYVDRPERLYSPDVRSAARSALERARAVPGAGPVLERQIATVERLVTAAETPLKVALTSDNLTEVTIYRVGRIGVFERRDVELLPGRYTLVGVRAGYRDVRRELTIVPGREAPTVVIRCEEPI